MPITFTCQCGKEFVAKDEHAGLVAKCTACGKDLVIPGQSGVQAAAAPAQPPPIQVGPPGALRQIFCPRCRAINSEQAIFCYACGANLAGGPSGPGFQPYGLPLYAGFWRRFVASFLDTIILSIVGCVVGGVVGLVSALPMATSRGSMPEAQMLITQIVAYLIGTVIGWLYFALMESSSSQATLGKMAIGLYVTDLNGQRISFGRATGRHFGKIISGLILMIGYIMAGFTEKKQALHDTMASCLVMRKS